MPKSKKKLITNQKRQIATRLMQISLLVDDYLYHEKPMSPKNAEAYIREISAYKDKCYQDVRSLQVIEKLTRFMKEIIFEQQELNRGDTVFPFQGVTNNVTLSPVYSIVDEDIQMLDHPHNEHDKELRPRHVSIEDEKETDLNKVITEEYNNTEITTEAKDPAVSNDIEVMDICDGEIVDTLNEINKNTFQNELEFTLHSAICNLSIKDIEEVFEVPFSQDCSQSLLDNFDPLNSYSLAKDAVTPLTQDNVPTATMTQQKPETDKEVFNDQTIKIVLPQTKTKHLNVKPIIIEKTQNMQKGLKDIGNEISKPRTPKPSNARNKNKTMNSVSSETVATIISNSVTNKKCTAKVTNKTRQVQKRKNVKEKLSKQFKREYKNDINTIQKPSIKQTVNQYESSGNKTHFTRPEDPPTQVAIKRKKANSNCVPSVYNSDVVNDLSWIENIRFVREVPSEEYESFAGGKNFWENCTLPQNWNEEDFNY